MGKDEFGRNRKFNQRGKEKQFDEIQEKDIINATKNQELKMKVKMRIKSKMPNLM